MIHRKVCFLRPSATARAVAMRSRAVSEEWYEEWSRLWCEAVVRKDGARSGDGGGGSEAAEVFKTPWEAAIPLIAIGLPHANHYHEIAHSAARFSASVIDVLSVAEPPTLVAAVLVLSEADDGADRRGSLGPTQFDRLLQRWDEERDAGRPDAWHKFEGQAARVAALQAAAAQSRSSPLAVRRRCSSPVAMRAMARARDLGPPARMGIASVQEIAAAAPLSEREAERRRRRRRAQFARADLDKNGRLDLNELLFARQVGGAVDCTHLSLDANPNPNPPV